MSQFPEASFSLHSRMIIGSIAFVVIFTLGMVLLQKPPFPCGSQKISLSSIAGSLVIMSEMFYYYLEGIIHELL